jgi:hypothetical protein
MAKAETTRAIKFLESFSSYEAAFTALAAALETQFADDETNPAGALLGVLDVAVPIAAALDEQVA